MLKAPFWMKGCGLVDNSPLRSELPTGSTATTTAADSVAGWGGLIQTAAGSAGGVG